MGSGTGILCAAFYELVRTPLPSEGIQVVGIEHIEHLVESSSFNISKGYS